LVANKVTLSLYFLDINDTILLKSVMVVGSVGAHSHPRHHHKRKLQQPYRQL